MITADPSAPGPRLFSAGAALGLVREFAETFFGTSGNALDATFGAVGAIAEKLAAGETPDLIILTRPMIDKLVAEGRVRADTVADLGVVQTGVAVRTADPTPEVADAASLRTALRMAEGIYFPDPVKATAGIHFASVVDRLGIRHEVEGCFRTFPNGATAMRELAQARGGVLIGVTQVTEILYTPGVRLVSLLPPELGLASTYTIGAFTGATDVALRFARELAGPALRAARERAGFNAGVNN